ncbi:MAG TPA: hypothetical protein VF941_21855 [Clostridia bacterium]
MDITHIFIAIAIILLIVFFTGDLFPACVICKKIKPGISLFFSKQQSIQKHPPICRKCCTKYNIKCHTDYLNFQKARHMAVRDTYKNSL